MVPAGEHPSRAVSSDPVGAIVALAPAAAQVFRLMQLYSTHGRAMPTDLRVGVVSKNYRLRGIYRRLGVGSAPLYDVAPAATAGRSGRVAVLGKKPGMRDWATVFVSSPRDLGRLPGVDLTVVELPVEDPKEIMDLRTPLILVASDPTDPLVVRLASKGRVFGWCGDDIGACDTEAPPATRALAAESRRLQNLALGRQAAPVGVASPAIAAAASDFWQAIAPVLKEGRESYFVRQIAITAYSLFYDLIHLCAPRELLESTDRCLEPRMAEVEEAQSYIGSSALKQALPSVVAALKALDAAVGVVPPKAAALLDILRRASLANPRERILLVARSAELARIYSSYFEETKGLAGRVEAVGPWAVAETEPSPLAVMTGMMPTSLRHLYGAGVGRETVVLAYTSGNGNASDGRFDESLKVRQAIEYRQAYQKWLSRPALKARCWSLLSGEAVDVPDPQPYPPRPSGPSEPVELVASPPDAPPGLWDGTLASVDSWSDCVDSEAGPTLSLRKSGAEARIIVRALRIAFADGRQMLLEEDATVTRCSKRGGEPEQGVRVTSVSPGDALLVLDGEARKDLLDKVLEVAGELPELAGPAAWIDYWRRALREASRRCGGHEGLHKALRERGSARGYQSVRLWVIGQVIGPQDPLDIRRVALVLGDATLAENYRLVNGAVEALRVTHRRLGRRLGALSREVGMATAAGITDDDEIIDERTGLTSSDFRNSIEILVVEDVVDAGDVPYALTGQIRQKGELDRELAAVAKGPDAVAAT